MKITSKTDQHDRLARQKLSVKAFTLKQLFGTEMKMALYAGRSQLWEESREGETVGLDLL